MKTICTVNCVMIGKFTNFLTLNETEYLKPLYYWYSSDRISVCYHNDIRLISNDDEKTLSICNHMICIPFHGIYK